MNRPAVNKLLDLDNPRTQTECGEHALVEDSARRRRSRKIDILEGAQGPNSVPNPPGGGGVPSGFYVFKLIWTKSCVLKKKRSFLDQNRMYISENMLSDTGRSAAGEKNKHFRFPKY